MQIWAHRGASADFPENTLPAFQAAVDQGADGVELDVMRCGSGELVVCHDERLDRLAQRPWEVARTGWWKLRQANVGAHRQVDARIPLLDEVLDLVPRRLTVNVELKCDTLDDRGLSEAVAQRLLERSDADRILVSSFNPLCLVRFAAHAPRVPRGWLIDPERSYFWQAHVWLPLLSPQAVHPHFAQCSPDRVAAWRREGRAVNVWTVDEPKVARALFASGVGAVITNQPAALRASLESAD